MGTAKNDEVRVRIAPSPTGDPHVGTAYIALFNYVFAKKHGGKFVLRVEDTDQVRAKSSSEGMILKSLKWLGLKWDEGPDCGGPYGPYRQSERTAHYQEHATILLDKQQAYRCFCTPERLTELRNQQKAAGQTSGYDRLCRNLSPAAAEARAKAGEAHVIRLKMPTEGMTTFEDKLRGKVEFDNQRLDDQVLLKADGFPTYHLANVVDDHLMHITHVIRAEEWISSTPKHVMLYKAFGWTEPTWVHMPLLRNADKSKISKRKNPVSLNYYRRAGYLPSALLNFLANMGWSFGDDQEIFTLDQMMERFDFSQISLGGPVFDIVKLAWMNHQYLKKLDDDGFANFLRDEIFSREYIAALKPLVIERMSKLEDFVGNNSFFFSGALDYTGLELVPKGKTKPETRAVIAQLVELLDELYDWDPAHIKDLLDKHKDATGWKPKDYFTTLRLLTTGRKDSPPLVESIALIGREMVRFRLRDVVNGPLLKD